MSRTVQDWIEIIKKHGIQEELTHFVTGDLTGYRTSSQWRSEDEKTLLNLFKAILEFKST